MKEERRTQDNKPRIVSRSNGKKASNGMIPMRTKKAKEITTKQEAVPCRSAAYHNLKRTALVPFIK